MADLQETLDDIKSNSKKASRTKKRSARGKDDKKFDSRFKEPKEIENDWSWYAQNEHLLRDTASFPYGRPLANLINYGPQAGDVANSTAIPGIMPIMISPTIGYSDNPNSAINLAAREVLAEVRKANSGRKNYDPNDLMIYLYSMSQIYAFIEWMRRVYGSMYLSSMTNWYAPGAVTYAQGVNYYDLIGKAADFRAYVNGFVTRVRKFAVPGGFPFIQRDVWIFQNLYMDTSQNDKAQMYLYNPEGFMQFTYDEGGAGALIFRPLMNFKYSSEIIDPGITGPQQGLTLDMIMAYGNSLLYYIIESEDHALMSGDILKAYGAERLIVPAPLADGYAVIPQYSEEILNQINNMTLCGRRTDPRYKYSDPVTAYNGVVQNIVGPSEYARGFLVSKPRTYITTPAGDLRNSWTLFKNQNDSVMKAARIINFESGPVEPADTMVASRFAEIADYTSGNNITVATDAWINERDIITWTSGYENQANVYSAEWPTADTWMANYAKIFYYAKPNRGASTIKSLIASEDLYTIMGTALSIDYTSPESVGGTLAASALKVADDHRRAALYSCFKRAPFLYLIHSYAMFRQVDGVVQDVVQFSHSNNGAIGDINYYTVLEEEDLKNMTATAVLSEFSLFKTV